MFLSCVSFFCYVEEFFELSNRVSWHDSALSACFQLGLDDETIHCDLPTCDFPLIKLINLVLYLNASDFEVEEIKESFKSPHPAPSGTRRVSPADPMPGTPTYLTNGSDHLPNPRYPWGRKRTPNPKASTPLKTGMIYFAPEVSLVLSIFSVLSTKTAADPKSSPLATQKSSPLAAPQTRMPAAQQSSRVVTFILCIKHKILSSWSDENSPRYLWTYECGHLSLQYKAEFISALFYCLFIVQNYIWKI